MTANLQPKWIKRNDWDAVAVSEFKLQRNGRRVCRESAEEVSSVLYRNHVHTQLLRIHHALYTLHLLKGALHCLSIPLGQPRCLSISGSVLYVQWDWSHIHLQSGQRLRSLGARHRHNFQEVHDCRVFLLYIRTRFQSETEGINRHCLFRSVLRRLCTQLC